MDAALSALDDAGNSTSGISLDDAAPVIHRINPVVSFIIGLAIVLLASILNAGGLNLTKLDHVRTSAVPKEQRKSDWRRPLWLLGMVLYCLSQLVGSTLALEYMRAEYVAPLGSTSLIFNFLFASALVGSPVTSNDIYGTVIVVFGVIGIVAFGSINSGLATEIDIVRLNQLWGRANWILFFIFMSISLGLLYIFVSQLELVLTSRNDLSSASPMLKDTQMQSLTGNGFRRRGERIYCRTLWWIREKLEGWTAAKDDKTVAWTLGIGWACCGGGLAGGTLVFAKATVKLISGSLSHENTGNQFFHFSAIFMFTMLAVTAVLQIVCLNRGLRIYDSTLVVPVFYGVYTASGFMDSLVFNNEVDAYKPWALFLIFVSICILIGGVVLLTHKKPEGGLQQAPTRPGFLASVFTRRGQADSEEGTDETVNLQNLEEGSLPKDEVMWELGEASDDEDGGDPSQPNKRGLSATGTAGQYGEEGQHLIGDWQGEEGEAGHDAAPIHERRSNSSGSTAVSADASLLDDAKWT